MSTQMFVSFKNQKLKMSTRTLRNGHFYKVADEGVKNELIGMIQYDNLSITAFVVFFSSIT